MPPGPSLIPLVGKLKPSVNQILFSFWPGCWTLDAAWLMGRRFSDRSLCSTSAGSDDQSLWKYPGLRIPFGAFVFPILGTKPTLLFHGPLLPACLTPLPAPSIPSTVPTNCRERFGGEKNQPAQMKAGENTHGDGRLRLRLSAQLDSCPGGPSSSWAGMERGKERLSSSFLFFMFFPYFSVSLFFSLPISCFLFLFHSALMP